VKIHIIGGGMTSNNLLYNGCSIPQMSISLILVFANKKIYL